MIIGGVAVIARGVPRLTPNIDATLSGEKIDRGDLVKSFRRHGIEAPSKIQR